MSLGWSEELLYPLAAWWRLRFVRMADDDGDLDVPNTIQYIIA